MRFNFLAATSLLAAVAQIAHAEFVCEHATTLATSTAGANGEVEVNYVHCSNAKALRAQSQVLRFEKRQTDVCGAPCEWIPCPHVSWSSSDARIGETNCFPGSVGTGPNPNDCAVIADALLYDSQNVGALFDMGANVRLAI